MVFGLQSFCICISSIILFALAYFFIQMIFITSHSADDISYVLLSIILTPFLLKYAQKFVVLFRHSHCLRLLNV
nr:hypothetical protein [Staphylococcus aureus]